VKVEFGGIRRVNGEDYEVLAGLFGMMVEV
jgi:hypothetical protein